MRRREPQTDNGTDCWGQWKENRDSWGEDNGNAEGKVRLYEHQVTLYRLNAMLTPLLFNFMSIASTPGGANEPL